MDVQTHARWFGPEDRPLLGWISHLATSATASGVVIAPPLGYPQLTVHRTLWTLAQRLAGAGHVAFRFDPDGTGDSAGDAWDPDRIAAWRASLAAAVAEVRALGCTRVTLVGVRATATFALLDGAALGADAVVAWRPLASGRRYAKELRMLSQPIPEEHARGCGAVAVAGDPWTDATLAELAAVPGVPDQPPAPRVALVDGGAAKLEAQLAALGVDVTVLPDDGSDAILETSAEKSTMPTVLIGAMADAIGASEAPPLAIADADGGRAETTLPGGLVERVITLGPSRLVAVVTEQPEPDPGAATLLLLNAGSEPHFGPGRAWVEFARELAARGHRCVRMDFRGWGETAGDASTPLIPYADSNREDVLEAVAALHERGHAAVVPFGLCAAAWVILKVAAAHRLDGAIALNPQMYWTPGQPIAITPEENDVHRTPARATHDRWARWHLWSALDAVGARGDAGRWLDALARSGTPTTLLFAENDNGVHFVSVRHGRRLARVLRRGGVELVQIPAIDHSMHRLWRREAVLEVLDARLSALRGGVADRDVVQVEV